VHLHRFEIRGREYRLSREANNASASHSAPARSPGSAVLRRDRFAIRKLDNANHVAYPIIDFTITGPKSLFTTVVSQLILPIAVVLDKASD
jgi:hypothetical protein